MHPLGPLTFEVTGLRQNFFSRVHDTKREELVAGLTRLRLRRNTIGDLRRTPWFPKDDLKTHTADGRSSEHTTGKR